MPVWRRILKSRPAWLGAAAIVIAVTLFFTYVARYEPDRQETIVLGQSSLFADSTAAFRILVRDRVRSTPIAGAQVQVGIEGTGRREELGRFVTGEDGSLSDAVHVPALAPGRYQLIVESSSDVGQDRIARPIEVKQTCRTYVTTDKPVYQPGQTIHMRALALDEVSLKPMTDQPILFEVTDAKGNKVFKADLSTSPYGLAFCDFTLADEVNRGDYHIRVTVGNVESDRVVQVQRYVLPKFKIALITDKPFYLRSEKIRGEVRAIYFFGKPVANAETTVTARTLRAGPEEIFRVTGTTDPNGIFRFDADVTERFGKEQAEDSDEFEPRRRRMARQENTPFQIEAVMKDSAGHEESTAEERTLARQGIDIYVFPESNDLLADVENALYILTAYPTGAPAVCDVQVNGTVLQSDPMGVTVFKATPRTASLVLNIRAQDAYGRTGSWMDESRTWSASNVLRMRTDKAVYQTDERPHVTILSRHGGTTFFLDVLRNGQTVLTRALRADEEGRAQLALDLPAGLWGTLVLKAYVVGSRDSIEMETRVVHVRRADELRVEAAPDKAVYRPGDTAKVQFQVTGADGAPVPAALSLAAVDEAVFYVCESQSGSVDEFFFSDGRLPLAGYRMAFAVSPAQVLSGEERYQNLARALFSWAGRAAGRNREYQSRRDDRDDMDVQIYEIYGDLDRQDYSLRAESRSQKLAEAELFRYEYLRVPLRVLLIVAVLTIPLCLMVVLARSLFRLFRQMAAEVNEQTQRLTSGAVDRRVYALVFTVLLPMTAYLTAVVITSVLDSYWPRDRFDIDPRLLGTLVVVASALATFGFPLIYRFGSLPFRQLGRTAAKVLTLPVLCIVLVYWITYVAARAIVRASGAHDHNAIGFLSLAAPFAVCLGLCWRAGVATRKPAGRFYTELGRSGHIVLVILLSQTLVLPAWILFSSDGVRGWLPSRPGRGRGLRLTVDSEPRWGGFHYGGMAGYDEGYMGGMMGGIGGYGGMATRSAPPRRYAWPEPPRVRRFFPETLLWQPQVITDEMGRAGIEVPLADSITAWKMNIDAVSAGGRLGNSTVDIRVFQDFFVDLDLPVALTRGDEVSVPVSCHNYLAQLQTVQLTLETAVWYEVQGPAVQRVELGPNEVTSVAFRVKAKEVGTHELAVLAQGSSLSDAVRRRIEVRPDGVEVEDLQSGVLSRSAEHTFHLPPESIPNSQKLLLRLYPSMFSEVIEGLDSIFQMPYGCFEQTSSVTYPNIMALLYMRRTGQTSPEIEVKARAYIAAGYQRLLTFEVQEGGFEWFGHPPAGEKVTAYGIMELTDMAQVYNVDSAVVDRASRWLLSRQYRDGSWDDSNQWQAEASRDTRVRETAYITWALAEAHLECSRLHNALEFLRQNVRETDSAYTVALAANALLAGDPNDVFGRKLLAGLQSSFRGDGRLGWVSSAGAGAMYSRGSCLDIETTALSVLAMMKVNAFADMVPKALTWLCEQKDRHGTWYSTQATVLAMKALIAGTSTAQKSDTPARVRVAVNNKDAGSIEVTPQTQDVLHTLDLTSCLQPGANTVRLTRDGEMELPYRLVGTHWTPRTTAAAPAVRALEIDVRYDRDHLRAGDVLRCTVQLLDAGATPSNMIVVELSLPPGFAADPAALDRLVDSGTLARYEMASDRVVGYVRSIAPKRRLRFSYELRALRPVRVQVPPSHVYEYYQPENRAETLPQEIVVE
jgi:hypothetical protein